MCEVWRCVWCEDVCGVKMCVVWRCVGCEDVWGVKMCGVWRCVWCEDVCGVNMCVNYIHLEIQFDYSLVVLEWALETMGLSVL